MEAPREPSPPLFSSVCIRIKPLDFLPYLTHLILCVRMGHTGVVRLEARGQHRLSSQIVHHFILETGSLKDPGV